MSRHHRAAALALGVLVLAGCGTSTSGDATPSPTTSSPSSSSSSAAPASGSGLPARARTFDAAALDPCTVVTADQLGVLGIDPRPIGPNKDTPEPGITTCTFTKFNPTTAYGVATDTVRSAADIASTAELTTTETIGGIGAVVVDGQGTGCTYFLDTSDTSSISVGSTTQGSTAAVDCPKAKALAEAAVTTLNALPPG